MHVLVIGAAGMVGRKLLDKIAAEPGAHWIRHRQADTG